MQKAGYLQQQREVISIISKGDEFLVIKERNIPKKIQNIEAVLRRIPSSHPKRVYMEEELAKVRAGYRGEQSLDYHFILLPEKQYLLIHDLRLSNHEGSHFQMDTLLLSLKLLLIIEAKNISGTITFDDHFHQLIRTINGKEEAFQDPLSQVKRHQRQLKDWIAANKFPQIPIKSLIVITNPSTIIKTSRSPENYPITTHSGYLVSKIEMFERMYNLECFTKKELTKLSRVLTKKHEPQEYDVLNQFNIKTSEIVKGVYCPECLSIPMQRQHGKWTCRECRCSSKTAHLESLKDYANLFGLTINNRQLCDFLLLSSSSIAKYLLKEMHLPYTGKGRNRVYYL
jgi:hypothetical protein